MTQGKLSPRLSPKDLLDIGQALYGPSFRRELARDLEVNLRTIQRWLDSRNPIPDMICAKLLQIVAARVAVLSEIMDRHRAP